MSNPYDEALADTLIDRMSGGRTDWGSRATAALRPDHVHALRRVARRCGDRIGARAWLADLLVSGAAVLVHDTSSSDPSPEERCRAFEALSERAPQRLVEYDGRDRRELGFASHGLQERHREFRATFLGGIA